MNPLSTENTRRLLTAINATGIDRVYQQIDGALGAIFTLHHVRPKALNIFSPNAHLSITPQELEETIVLLKERNFEFVAMDEIAARILKNDPTHRFAAFTFDDGYRDNFVNAVPILKAYQIPYTIYLAPGLIDGSAILWWEVLEEVLNKNDAVVFVSPDKNFELSCITPDEKNDAFQAIVAHLINDIPETEIQPFISVFANAHGVDAEGGRLREIATWEELKKGGSDPLCMFGTHSLNHPALRRLTPEQCRGSMRLGDDRHSEMLGEKARHFAFPFGNSRAAGPREFEMAKKLEFQTAVTTRAGLIYPEHINHLNALPRISLNGLYQKRRYTSAIISGFPTRMLNGMRRLNVD